MRFTVRALTCSVLAISPFVLPFASSAKSFVSRGVAKALAIPLGMAASLAWLPTKTPGGCVEETLRKTSARQVTSVSA